MQAAVFALLSKIPPGANIISSRFSERDGESYLLITVLACFLGGVNPFGGFGKVVSVFLALIVLQVLSSGLNLMGASQHLATAIWGIMLVAVMVARWAAGQLSFLRIKR